MNKKPSVIYLVIFLCLSVFAWSTHGAASQKDGLLKVYFLDVGQGDSIFIEAPNGNQVLIDGGPDNKVLSELSKIMPFYDHSIDVVLATHTHSDHISGLISVLGRYDIGHVIETKNQYNSPQYKAWEEAVKNENTDYIEAIRGDKVDLGNGASITILYPDKSYDGSELKNPHDADVVAMLEYGSFRALLTGDAETNIEKQLITGNIKADILKVGHHGSTTSSSDEFLKAVSPQLAFIEVGAKNQYNLPSQEILDRLERNGIKYYRTDQNGTKEIESDGNNFWVEN